MPKWNVSVMGRSLPVAGLKQAVARTEEFRKDVSSSKRTHQLASLRTVRDLWRARALSDLCESSCLSIRSEISFA